MLMRVRLVCLIVWVYMCVDVCMWVYVVAYACAYSCRHACADAYTHAFVCVRVCCRWPATYQDRGGLELPDFHASGRECTTPVPCAVTIVHITTTRTPRARLGPQEVSQLPLHNVKAPLS